MSARQVHSLGRYKVVYDQLADVYPEWTHIDPTSGRIGDNLHCRRTGMEQN